jgi:preprotein translocase subunit SecY
LVLLAAMLVIIVVTVMAIVYVQQGRRNVPIMYPQKSQVFYAMQRGKKVRMPQPTLPLNGQPGGHDPA